MTRSDGPAAVSLRIVSGLLVGALMVASAPSSSEVPAEETDQYGVSHAWSGPSDRYTVIDFAAAWCRPCIRSLPRIQRLANAHPGVRFLVVSVDEKEEGRAFLVKELALELPVIWDQHANIVEHYSPEGMPATYVLDPNGKIVYHHVGFTEALWRDLVALIERVEN